MYIGAMADVTVQLMDCTGFPRELVVDMDYYKRLPFRIKEEVTISGPDDKGFYTLKSVTSGRTGLVTLRNQDDAEFIHL